jgi:hypothetical protein
MIAIFGMLQACRRLCRGDGSAAIYSTLFVLDSKLPATSSNAQFLTKATIKVFQQPADNIVEILDPDDHCCGVRSTCSPFSRWVGQATPNQPSSRVRYKFKD